MTSKEEACCCLTVGNIITGFRGYMESKHNCFRGYTFESRIRLFTVEFTSTFTWADEDVRSIVLARLEVEARRIMEGWRKKREMRQRRLRRKGLC